MTVKPSLRELAALALVPALFVAVLFAMRASSLPFWQSFNLDPDYYYLLNGLRIVELLAPTDVGHPGTPVQVFVALVLRLMHPGMPTGAVVEAVLAEPEHHLVVVTSVLYPLVGLALWWMGQAFRAATGRLAPALLAQSAPFLSMIIPKFAIHAKPEPFLIIAVGLLMVAALKAATAERLEDRHAGWLGVALGFGIACKLHFFALGMVPLFILDRRRLFLVLPLATVAAFLVFVSPAIPSRDIWFDWMGRVFLHSGAYGTGAETVIDPRRYPRAIIGLFGSKLIFTITLAASLAALAGYFRLRRRGLVAQQPMAGLLGGMVLAELFTVVLIAKQPAAHYMVPAVMLTGPSLAALWVLTARVFPAKGHARGWALVAAVLTVVTAQAVWRQNAELAGWTRDAQAFDMGRFASCAKVDYDSASTLPYALQRGDMNALGRYSPKLAERMPKDQYTWFINDHSWWNRGFMWWNQPRSLAEVIATHPCTVFRGNQPYNVSAELNRLAPGTRFDDRCEVGEETILTIGVKCDGQLLRPLAN
jgi:hypothetical protein